MTTLSILLDNPNPLITYLPPGAWTFRSPSNPADAGLDTAYARYSDGGTFSVTTTYAASASFSFNGTGVTLYGAKRGNHGFYNITLDGAFVGSYNGSTDLNPGIWGPLYSSGQLDDGLHQVVFLNAATGGRWQDLDYIIYNTTVSTQPSLVQDTDPSFAYEGYSWSENVASQNQYNGTSGHISCTNDASVVYTFQVCDSVQLYGVLSPNMGAYTISLDGQPALSSYSAYQEYFYANTMLYGASGLAAGSHTLTLTNVGGNGSCLSVDYALAGPARYVTLICRYFTDGSGQLFSLVKLSSSAPTCSSSSHGSSSEPTATTSGAPSSTNVTPTTTHTSASTIGGAVSGAVVGLALLIAGLWFLHRRRQQAARLTSYNNSLYPYTATSIQDSGSATNLPVSLPAANVSQFRESDLPSYSMVVSGNGSGERWSSITGCSGPSDLHTPPPRLEPLRRTS